MKNIYVLLQSFILLLLVDKAHAQLKLGDQPTSVQKSVILDLQGSNGRQGVWLPRISDTTNATGIDALNPPDGVLIFHTPTAEVMIRRNGYWTSMLTTTKVGSTTASGSLIEFQLGTAAGASKDLNLALNSSTGVVTLNVPDAAADTRGVVTTGSQSFGGLKTFADGLTSSSTTTVTGASSNGSNLYLGITSATTPGATTDRFLSVDNTGRVILAEGIPSGRTMTINGTSYDLTANRTWNVGTVTSIAGGYGLNGGTITSSGTLAVDTSAISTRAWRQKGIDSIAGLFSSYIPASRTLTINGTSYDLSANRTWNVGTVTSVAGGYGISGGTITSTGTHSIDTALISTRAWRQKGIDSVAGLLNAYVPATRTLNGLAFSSNQTFATGTSGTNFNISSSGTTHTFNLPDASATARGVVTTGAQSFNGLKTFNNGLTSSSTTTVTGASGNGSNLYLGITSATTPGAITDRYLSVDATGRVILSDIGVINNLAAIGNTPNANGATLSSGTFTLQPASASFGGVVTTGTQTFAGTKTFNDLVTARLTPQAGTAAAGTAPIKLTSGTNLGTPEDGAVEFDGTNYYVTSGTTRYTLAKTLTATATLDFPSTGIFSTSTLTVTVNGAVAGDVVVLGLPSGALPGNEGTYMGYVSAANTVTIAFTNSTWGSINPASGTFRVTVLKY
ncbi:MAG TPA: hypothetical protein VF145_04140 [Chitinophagaceae bacterium]